MPASHAVAASSTSARKTPPKSICFELLLDESTKVKARIPLRVVVNAHDTTESIVTTVKSFYGIYDGHGIGFEDGDGSSIIAAYDNFVPNTTVYVRAIPGSSQNLSNPNGLATAASIGNSPRKSALAEPFNALPPHMRDHSQSPTRGSSRLASKGSVSPSRGRGRRSTPAAHHKSTHAASRGSSTHDGYRNGDFSDSDAGHSSVSGSRKARSEQYTADIDPSNIVPDGGRRGNANLFTAELLPLYTPNIVPVTASHDSNSPMRRPGVHEGPSPAHLPSSKLYDTMAPPLMSPSSYNNNNNNNNIPHPGWRSDNHQSNGYSSHDHRLRARETNLSNGRSGILPTPDPTVASCISDEDVARTLMALGNASSYGRTSTSTLDETFSVAADASSSTGASSESEDYSEADEPKTKYRRVQSEVDGQTRASRVEADPDMQNDMARPKKVKTKSHDGPAGWKPTGIAVKKTTKSRTHPTSKVKHHPAMKAPLVSSQVRKESTSSSVNLATGVDEDDLSSKPRCQRCRKSKKGCDRQRPCGRCKDAGIGPEGCISEDEGNGRKGRYGRHMGVPLKQMSMDGLSENDGQNTIIESVEFTTQGSPSKKRKR